MRVRGRALFLAVIGVSCGVSGGGSSAQGRTTVCDLARHPQMYRSQRVEVSGEFRGGLDRLLLSDRSCPNRPVALSISNDVAKQPDVAPLWSAIYREGSIGTVGKHISATVRGTYRYERREWPGGVLSVEGVRDLQVRRSPQGS